MLENILSLKVQGGYFVNETDDFPLFQNTINILYGRMVVENLLFLELFGNSRRMEMKTVRIENIQLVSMRILISRQSMCLMKILLRKKF